MYDLIDPITLGKIGATYGIKGWLKIFSYTENVSSIFDYKPWFIKLACKWQLIELEDWKQRNHDMIIKIKNIDDRDKAAQLTHYEIFIDSSQLPILANGDYYWKDLISCKVVNIDGYEIGIVIDLIETGSNDVLIVKTNTKDAFDIKEQLIPFIDKKVIKKVDLAACSIEVDWDLSF